MVHLNALCSIRVRKDGKTHQDRKETTPLSFSYVTITAKPTHSVKAVMPRQGNIKFHKFLFIYLFIS